MDTLQTNDIVADLPTELAVLKKITGTLPSDVEFEPGYYCKWNNRYCIHTRVTLPLKAVNDGVGFGLWVEISKEDFEKYLEAENDDTKYVNIHIRGTLANEWPGFENMEGVPVTVRAISKDEKVYITEVHMDKPRDPIFEAVLLTQRDDDKGKEHIRKLVGA
jgi:hypothetical protein